jgi:hypothetical protein
MELSHNRHHCLLAVAFVQSVLLLLAIIEGVAIPAAVTLHSIAITVTGSTLRQCGCCTCVTLQDSQGGVDCCTPAQHHAAGAAPDSKGVLLDGAACSAVPARTAVALGSLVR